MKIDKKIKKQIIEQASSNPEKYFPVSILKEKGFKRIKCSKCGIMFWSVEKRDICGDTNCVGKYSFIEDTPAKNSFEFVEIYNKWENYIHKRGYMPVKRFPVVARWRDDLDFNVASIIGFQPYVTKGLVAPSSKMLTIPQNCLRFPDIDNVGFTGRHTTGFTMIGQHVFLPPKEYDQEKYFIDLLDFFLEILQIPISEIQIHEDAWTGGGDCGPSVEFFSRGLELANQVYMWFDMSSAEDISELKPLKLKVLDMGMGHERICWFSKGSLNQYEAVMPRVCQYLFEKVKLKPDWDLYKKFLPYSGTLNLDETDDIEKTWEELVKKMNVNKTVNEVKSQIEPIAGIYSIADHTRTLLYALTDGALPSNVKGGYNIRLILRRALDFIYKFKWDIDLYDVIFIHAEELEGLYPELKYELKGIKKIIDLEVEKYNVHKKKVENKIKSLIKKKSEFLNDEFIKYYISDGITPDEIKSAFKKYGIDLSIPDNFYTLVNEYFENRKLSETKQIKNKLSEYISDLPDTKLVFYEDFNKSEEDFKILKEFSFNSEDYIVLDKTLFYPTMGGQASDIGYIGDRKVVEAIKVGNVVVHKVK